MFFVSSVPNYLQLKGNAYQLMFFAVHLSIAYEYVESETEI